jgi:hypothetical protein
MLLQQVRKGFKAGPRSIHIPPRPQAGILCLIVILFDARGHGKGDKLHQAATYDRQLMVGDVLAVLDA